MNDISPRGRSGIAWAVILLTATVVIAGHILPDEAEPGGDSMDLILLQMQSQYIVGTRQWVGADDRILAQTAALNTGSVTQRQSYVALTGELAGPDAAADALVDLADLIRREQASASGFELTPDEARVQEALERLFPVRDEDDDPNASPAEPLPRLAALSAEDRDALTDHLGWIGRLALAPEGTDEAVRKPLLAQAGRVTLVVIGVFGTLLVLGLLGAAGLVALAVMAAGGKLQSGLGASTTHHGIYAETFAIWMVAFVLLQLVAEQLAALVPRVSLGITAAGFLASLGALAWPRLRGIAWEHVRADVGLVAGKRRFLEPLFGVGGYVLALPMLAVGILCTLLLMMIQAAFSGGAATFASTAPPAHPIVGEIAHAGWGIRVQILVLAAVVAPIVEETMFRGVLYRHLRDATAGLGLPLSILASAALNGLLFAAIHPQGWVAIPALMSLACAFVLVREWRGTLIPSMIVHGISNGLVMLMLIAIVGT